MGICIFSVDRDRKYVQFKTEDSGGIKGISVPRVFVRSRVKLTRGLKVVAKSVVVREGTKNGIETS